jgi:hypothetical protein
VCVLRSGLQGGVPGTQLYAAEGTTKSSCLLLFCTLCPCALHWRAWDDVTLLGHFLPSPLAGHIIIPRPVCLVGVPQFPRGSLRPDCQQYCKALPRHLPPLQVGCLVTVVSIRNSSDRLSTTSVVQWSEFLAANPEVLGSIPDAPKCSV